MNYFMDPYRPIEKSESTIHPNIQNLSAHFSCHRFRPLIRQEQLVADALLEERLLKWPITRLVEEGYAILNLIGFWSEQTHFGRPIAVFALGPGVSLGWNRFE